MQWGKTPRFKGYQRVSVNGISFASKLEAALYQELSLLQKAGILRIEKIQDHVYLSKARIGYIPDFKTWDNEFNDYVWYEAKGFESERWPIIKKLWKHYGPGRLRIYKGTYRKLKCVEEIVPVE